MEPTKPWRPRWRAENEEKDADRKNGRGWRAASTRGGRTASERHRRRERRRPNYFVGFRIVNQSIISAIRQLQQRILESHPELDRCMVDPRTLHVTLCVLHLQDEHEIEEAKRIIETTVGAGGYFFAGEGSPFDFDFRGVEFFGSNTVLYTPMVNSSPNAMRLGDLAESLHNAFDVAGFSTETFRKPYTPHLTIWKASRDWEYINDLNKYRPRDLPIQDALAAFLFNSETELSLASFGRETLSIIELLSMREKEADGYYKIISSTSLVG